MGVRKVLPIAEPDITSYAHLSYSLSVMHTDESCLDWIYSNFIQLYTMDRGESLFLDYFSPTVTDYPIPAFYGKSHLNRDLILRNYERFGDFLRESIDDGRYVSTYVDDYFIPGTVAYQNRSNPHGILVYGYDDDKRHFQITGYLANQTYGHTTVDYDNIETAFKEIRLSDESDYKNFTHLFKLNPKYGYDFNLQWVMDQLEDYTFGKSSVWRWEGFQGKDGQRRVWGIGIYDELIRKVREQMEGTFILDHRPIHVIWEHKRMMNKRIAYMESRDYYFCTHEVKEGYARLERMAATSRHQILKYWMTKDNRRLEELINQLNQLKQEEAQVNERMLQEYPERLNVREEEPKMAARRLLPITEPDLVSYPHLAFPLAMLQTDSEAQRWVYSNYVQLYLSDRTDEMMMDFFTPNPFDYFVPILHGSPRMNRTLVRRSYPSFAEFVRVSIDESYYLWTHVDEYYIPGTSSYRNKSFPHGIMIHGYDDEQRVFHVVGFLSHQRYGSGEVGYDDMEKAYFDFEPPEWKAYTEHSILLKTYPGFLKANAFNLRWVMEQLHDYLRAKPSDQRMPAFELQLPSSHAWGMAVYDRLQERLRLNIENAYIVDHRSFYVLWEHKKMMNRRIAYMAREGYYLCSSATMEGWSNLEKQASLNLNLILKYWMTRDPKHLETLIDRIDRMKADETLIIERMLREYEAFSSRGTA